MPGGIFLTCSCTGLVGEADFLESLRRAAWQAGRVLQIIRISGAAWGDGTPLKSVELKIDDGPWTPAVLGEQRKYAWTFWSYDWKGAVAGEHTLVSRAIDVKGRVQPSADDPWIKLKKTFWEANQQYPRKIKI